MARRPSVKHRVSWPNRSVTDFRLYTFMNFYLSSIQQGIQTAHVVSELMHKYRGISSNSWVDSWAGTHKTIIVCNGGMGGIIQQEYRGLIDAGLNAFPHASFAEEHLAFGASNVMTGFGIVLPSIIYNAKPIWTKPARGPARKTGDWECGTVGVDRVVHEAGTIEAAVLEYMTTKPLAR